MTQQRKEVTAIKPLSEDHVKRLKKHDIYECSLCGAKPAWDVPMRDKTHLIVCEACKSKAMAQAMIDRLTLGGTGQ